MIKRKLNEINFKVFVDFDGTISLTDIGEELFAKFGDREAAYEIIGRWLDGEIGSIQSWRELCDSLGEFDIKAFYKFVDSLPIDPGFHDFVKYCSNSQIDIYVVSDGLDFYINRFMARENLQEIPVYSNRAVFLKENKILPDFPYRDEECDTCANCKRNHVINNSHDDDFTIYIGDGNSDTCPAQYCDFIFAKNSLLKFCEKNRISFFPYKNFHDVIERMEQLGEKKRLRKRHQAELKRREVYMRG